MLTISAPAPGRCVTPARSPTAPGETWRGVDDALRHGLRGLPVGVGLARLLTARRGARNRTCLPRLSSEQILAWAEAHHRRTRVWPTSKSGPVADAEEENWKGIDTALSGGYRGLAGGSSLARLLAEQRGVRNRANLPSLTRAEDPRLGGRARPMHGTMAEERFRVDSRGAAGDLEGGGPGPALRLSRPARRNLPGAPSAEIVGAPIRTPLSRNKPSEPRP